MALSGAAGVVLAVALASQYLGGLQPCALCVWQRAPYAAAVALGALALVAPRWALRGLCLAFVAGAGLALTHAGVEWGWWPSPLAACASAITRGPRTIDQMLAQLAPAPVQPCDAPTFLIPGLPVSMAVMNLLLALSLTVLAIIFLRNARRTSA